MDKQPEFKGIGRGGTSVVNTIRAKFDTEQHACLLKVELCLALSRVDQIYTCTFRVACRDDHIFGGSQIQRVKEKIAPRLQPK